MNNLPKNTQSSSDGAMIQIQSVFNQYTVLSPLGTTCTYIMSYILFGYLFMYLATPGLSYDMQDLSCNMWTLSCSMWDLVPGAGIKPRAPALGA